MAETLASWNRGQNFSAIREAWLERSVGLGKPIVARFEGHELRGTFEALDESGHLLLRDAQGKRHFVSAADIFFGTLAPNTA